MFRFHKPSHTANPAMKAPENLHSLRLSRHRLNKERAGGSADKSNQVEEIIPVAVAIRTTHVRLNLRKRYIGFRGINTLPLLTERVLLGSNQFAQRKFGGFLAFEISPDLIKSSSTAV